MDFLLFQTGCRFLVCVAYLLGLRLAVLVEWSGESERPHFVPSNGSNAFSFSLLRGFAAVAKEPL